MVSRVRKKGRSLLVPSSSRATQIYPAEVEGKLLQDLKAQKLATIVKVIENPKDLFMSSEGLVGGRYRFSRRAFDKLASYLVDGLSTIFVELTEGSGPSSTALPNHKLAVDIYNEIIKVRADRVIRHNLLIDTDTSTVDGVFSDLFYHISNVSFYSICRGHMNVDFPEWEMHSATIFGRHFSARFVGDKPLFEIALSESRPSVEVYPSIVFINSDSGIKSARISPAFYIPLDDMFFVVELSTLTGGQSGRISHLRNTFSKKLKRALSSLPKAIAAMPAYKSTFEALAGDYGADIIKPKIIKNIAGDIRDKYKNSLIPKSILEKALSSLFFRNRSGKIPDVKVYDVCCAIDAATKSHNLDDQETNENAMLFYLIERAKNARKSTVL